MSMRVFVGFQRFSLKYCSGGEDKQPFLGSDMVRTSDGSWRLKTYAEQKRDAERNAEASLVFLTGAHPNEKEDHSYRSATVGSMPTARIAGIRQASKAMAARRIATDTKVSGSVGLTP